MEILKSIARLALGSVSTLAFTGADLMYVCTRYRGSTKNNTIYFPF